MDYLAAAASGERRNTRPDPFEIVIERDPMLTPAVGVFSPYDLAYTEEACNDIDFGDDAVAACKADLQCISSEEGCPEITCTEDRMDTSCFHRALLKHRELSMKLVELQNNRDGAQSRQVDFDEFYNAELIKMANLGVGVVGVVVGIVLVLRNAPVAAS